MPLLPSDDEVHSQQSLNIIAGKDFLRTFTKEKKKGKAKRKCKKSCQVSRIACDQLYHEWSDVHAIHGKLNERKQFCLRRLLKSRYISFPIPGQYRLFAIEN